MPEVRTAASRSASAATIAFLFGAGASFAVGQAGHVSPVSPPLTAGAGGLYDCLAAEYPKEWGPDSSLASYAEEFRADFEVAYGARLANEFAPSLTLLEKLVPFARFFARFALRPGGSDLYSQLVAGIRDAGLLPRTIFGSLNYDVLLERSIERLDLGIDYLLEEAHAQMQAKMAPPRHPECALVAKLHGSCNFVSDVEDERRLHLMASSSGTVVEVPIRTFLPSQLTRPAREDVFGRGRFPIMCLVERYKNHLLSPSRMTIIRGIWGEEVRKAATVVVIGARRVEQDPHVWEPLRDTAARRLYIGGKSDFDAWHDLNPGRWEHVAERWESVGPLLEAILTSV